jgi:Na+-driven multidrug efflux pump
MDILIPSIPAVLSLLFEMLIEVITMVFIGHLNDPLMMAGNGLGMMMMNVGCMGVALGLCGAIDTLVSQAYGDK